jgi:SAM-dependent methyltransferase
MRSAQPDRTPIVRVSCRVSGSGCPDFLTTYAGIEVCPVCGLGRTIAGTAAANDQDYLDPQEVGGADRPDYFRVLFDTYCKDVMPGRALDIGCGRGEWVRLLSSHGWTAHGIDAFRDFQPDNINFFRAGLDSYFPDFPYDFITLIHCFEHLADPLASLKRLADLLKPGGRLLIVVPNFGGAWSRLLAGNWHMLRTDHHAFHYTPKSLTRILENCDYRVLRTSTCSQYAPSILQLRLERSDFYRRGIGSIRPLRSLISRMNALLRVPLNRRLDDILEGAEVQALASLPLQRSDR